jgi:hypothetical protein
MEYSKKSPVAKITQLPPVRRFMDNEGVIREEKVPATPHTRKMVTPQGNVVRVPLATGRTIGDEVANLYKAQKLPEKLKKGFLLYSECPYANGSMEGQKPCKGIHPMEQQVANLDFNGRLPPGPGNSPMVTVRLNTPGAFWKLNETNPKGFVEEKCCPHIEEIIQARQAMQRQKNAEFAEQFKTSADRVWEMEEKRAQAKLEEETDG